MKWGLKGLKAIRAETRHPLKTPQSSHIIVDWLFPISLDMDKGNTWNSCTIEWNSWGVGISTLLLCRISIVWTHCLISTGVKPKKMYIFSKGFTRTEIVCPLQNDTSSHSAFVHFDVKSENSMSMCTGWTSADVYRLTFFLKLDLLGFWWTGAGLWWWTSQTFLSTVDIMSLFCTLNVNSLKSIPLWMFWWRV